MIKDKVNIGVVGVGHLGRWHVQQLKTIRDANLVGVYDVDSQRAHQVADEFDTHVFDSFDKLLRNCNALSIVTPTTTHFEYAKKALLNNKHIFIEKPITETVEQGNEIVDLAEKRNLKLQVGHIERFNPALLAVEEFIHYPLFIESHRLSTFNPRGTDVAVVLDLMIHDIDLILSFIKSPVKYIHASGVSIISQTEDIANCRLEFKNGAVANVTASRISTRKMRKMRFFQPNAYLSVDFLEGTSEVYQLVKGALSKRDGQFTFPIDQKGDEKDQKSIQYSRYEKKDLNPLNYELSLFIQSILKDETPAVTGKEAVRALRIARKILKSINKHAETVKKHLDL